ncbi:MAG: FAD-binding oxidoreductase [Planctomycetaceae bacterium]|nr:FAD-binding oxidoreductase [Planctomycetaceae bacterium]
MTGPATQDEFIPKTASSLARYITENVAGDRVPLTPVGGRTALRQGYDLPDKTTLVSMADLTHIIDYPARDMTITLEAGFRVEELQSVLAGQGQRLPLDIPQAHRATIGGAIATNTSGLGRFGNGTLRDYVIGISAVDGTGRLFKAGGRVVKNVAGYDLCKLLVGSLGTLAVITQVTLKLRPLAATRRIVWSTFPTAAAIESVLNRLLTSATRPIAMDVLCPTAAWQIKAESKQNVPIDRFVLAIAYEGTEAETQWQTNRLKEELSGTSVEEVVVADQIVSDAVWTALTEYPAASDDPLTFQASLPPSRAMEFVDRAHASEVAVQCHAGNGVIIGHLPDACTSGMQANEMLTTLRDKAESAGGSLVILSCDDEWKSDLPLFGSPRNDWPLMRRVKDALDPYGVLSPNRIWSPSSSASV